MSETEIEIETLGSLSGVDPVEWDACACPEAADGGREVVGPVGREGLGSHVFVERDFPAPGEFRVARQVGRSPFARSGVLVEAPEGVPVFRLQVLAGEAVDRAA